MKVAMITPYPPPRLGGREFWVDWMSQELARKGVEVVVFTSNVLDYHRFSRKLEVYHSKGVKYYKLPVIADIDKYSTPVVWPPFLALMRENPDIVHIHEPNLFLTTPMAFFARLVLKKKLVTHCYSDPFDWHSQGFLFKAAMGAYGLLYHWKLRLADAVIALSEEYRSQSRQLPRWRNKTTLLPMCLAPVFRKMDPLCVELFRKEKNIGPQPVVLYVGRLDTRKGVDVLIRAMAKVDGAQCLIVGNGEQQTHDDLVTLAREPHLENKVRFMGRADQEELNLYYNSAAMLVLPTVDHSAETFGAVLLEAWASGTPVISADNPAPAKLIGESGGGLLVPRGDSEELARSIQSLLADPRAAAQMGAQGQTFALCHFSLDSTSDKLMHLYQKIIGCS